VLRDEEAGIMEVIRYVVVVHGIGEQRQNETVISVVSRCAEARRALPKGESYDVLTLGMACSQTGKAGANATAPWLEFRGIPQEPSPSEDTRALGELKAPFLGEKSQSGENLRFVDLHWADLLQADIADVGQTPEVWSDGLLGRLKRKNEQLDAEGQTQKPGWFQRFRATPPDPRRAPSWAIEILRILKETITLLRRFTTLRAQKLDEMIFTKFLGDVQLYGEYAYCRGQAVRRFHELIARIEKRHDEEEKRREQASGKSPREARYTIVAHSLGSIMSFDALLYAHARPEVLVGTAADAPGLPFPGHLREEDPREREKRAQDVQAFREAKDRLAMLTREHGIESEEVRAAWQAMKRDDRFRFLDTSWLERVDSFVTLGSPIDKFLVLWWLNYKHLLRPAQWMDPGWIKLRKIRKIRLFNYADEQDPVGHHLDVAATAPAVQEVFAIEEDKVYNRSAVPGLAHTSYWKDLPLFKRIVYLAIDGGGKKDAKAPIVRWFDAPTYQKALTYAYYVIPYAVLALHFFTFTWAMYSQSWHGRTIASVLFFGTFLLGRRLIDLSLWWRQVLKAKKCQGGSGYAEKERAGTRFRWRLGILCLLYLGLAGISFGTVLHVWPDLVPFPRLGFIGLIFSLSLIVWWLLFMDHQTAWRSKHGAEDSATPVMDLNEGALPIEIAASLMLAAAWGGGFLLTRDIPHLAQLPEVLVKTLTTLSVGSDLAARIGARMDEIFMNLASLFSLAAVVFSYTGLRFLQIRSMVRGKGSEQTPDFVRYAEEVMPLAPTPVSQGRPPVTPVADPLPQS
jgi:hypothetical protein